MLEIPKKIKEKKYKVVDKLTGYVKKITLKFFKTEKGKTEVYFVDNHKDSVQIFAMDIDEKVILVDQFRPAKEKIVCELPGGTLEKNESIYQAAERELEEETGYKVGKLFYVGEQDYSVGSSGKKYFFIAIGCFKNGVGQRLDDLERINVRLETVDGFRELLRNQKIFGADLGYLGLDKLKLL